MVKFIVPQLLLFGTPDNIGSESGSGSAEGLQTKYPYRPFIGSHKKLRNLCIQNKYSLDMWIFCALVNIHCM